MELAFLAWALDVIPNLSRVFGVGGLLLLIISAILIIPFWIEEYSRSSGTENMTWREAKSLINEKYFKKLYKALTVVGLMLVIANLIPSEKGLKWIVGAYLAQTTYEQVVEIDGVKELPEKAVSYMTDFFDTVEVKKEVVEQKAEVLK